MSINIENKEKVARKLRVIFSWIIIFLCIFPLFYMTLYRYVDGMICDNRIEQHLDLSESTPTLVMYIYSVVQPEMNRVDVHARLAEISNYIITKKLPYRSETMVAVEDIQLKTCSHPFNNVRIILRYSEEDKLLSVYIPEDNANFIQTFFSSP